MKIRKTWPKLDRLAKIFIATLLINLLTFQTALTQTTVSPVGSKTVLANIPSLPRVSGALSGSIGGSFDVNDYGAATYNIPIAIAPGTMKMAPNISLSYNSQNEFGILGTAWAISGLSIMTRCPTTISVDGYRDGVDYDEFDRFCLDGQRLIAISGVYGAANSEYRTMIASFAKITASGRVGNGPASFTVLDKSGLKYFYGSREDARIEHVSASGVLSWLLNRVEDREGNWYEIHYNKDTVSGETVPTRIEYTGNIATGLAPYNSVDFTYDDMPIAKTRYLAGGLHAVTKRLRKIKISVDGQPAWEYRLDYQSDPVKNGVQLERITECDFKDICLPSTELRWGETTTESQSFVFSKTLSDLTPGQGYTDNIQEPIFTGDWNGDGLTDIGRVHGATTKFYKSTPAGFELYSTVTEQSPNVNGETFSPVIGDWNGDGKTDFARFDVSPQNGTRAELRDPSVYRSTGTGFANLNFQQVLHPPTGTWSSSNYNGIGKVLVASIDGDGKSDIGVFSGPKFYSFLQNISIGFNNVSTPGVYTPNVGDCSLSRCPVFVGDWNGDGLADFGRVLLDRVEFFIATSYYSVTFYRFRPYAVIYDYGYNQGFTNLDDYPLLIEDFNGDGLTDFARVRNDGVMFHLSTGKENGATSDGFEPGVLFQNFGASGYRNHSNYPIVTGDWNKDGTTDIARAHPDGIITYIVEDGVPTQAYFIRDLSYTQGYSTQRTHPLIVGDWNGDGFSDIARVGPNEIKFYEHVYSQPQLLEEIIDGLGSRTLIEYKQLTDTSVYEKGTTAVYPDVDIQSSMHVVSKVTKYSNATNGSSTSYNYKGLRIDTGGEGTSGFSKVIITDDQTGAVKEVTYSSNPSFRGLPEQVEVKLGNGTLIGKTLNTYTTRSVSAYRYFTYAQRIRTEQYETDGTLVKWEEVGTTQDVWGNPTRVETTRSDGSSELVENTYTNDTQNWLIGLLTECKSTATARDTNLPRLARLVRYTYTPGSARVAEELLEPNDPSISLSTRYEYDSFGNIVRLTNSAPAMTSRTSEKRYDPTGRFVTEVINPLGHRTHYRYDPRSGLKSYEKDSNGLVERKEYDSFGRLSLELHADGTQTRTVYYKVDPNMPNTPADAAYFIRIDSSGIPPTMGYFDSFSREVRKEALGFDNRKIFIDKAYDDRSNLTHESEPYFEGQNPIWNINEYDQVNRVIRIIAPGNRQTSISYQGLTKVTTNPLQQNTTEVMDAQSQVVETKDHYNNSLYFAHDANGNIVETRDSRGVITRASYNLRGFRTRLEDRNAGSSDYAYNNFGELISKTDANQNTITFNYDRLGRMVERLTPEGRETWEYDTKPNAVGLLVKAQGLDGYELEHSYDHLSRIKESKYVINSKLFTTHQYYDALGRASITSYPSGFRTKRIYSNSGHLARIERVDNGSMIWEADTINARGQIEEEVLGNTLRTRRAYSANTGLLNTIETPGVQNLTFRFDNLGNLVRRRDLLNGLNEQFTYDNLNRLTSSQVIGNPVVRVSYDDFGNITYRSDTGSYIYGLNAGPNAVVAIVGPRPNTYRYDANGNRISSINGQATYNSRNLPVTISESSIDLDFKYDPENKRVQQLELRSGQPFRRTTYVGNYYEEVETRNYTERLHYIATSNGTVAIFNSYNSSTGLPGGTTGGTLPNDHMKYLHRDHLGSIQSITDEAGHVIETSSYNSWGERRDPRTWTAPSAAPSSISRGFTGHEELTGVRLVHMNGRIYDPVVGRFLSADPFVQFKNDLQSYNRYSYVRNNPLSFTDPSGFFLRGFFKKLGRLLKRAIPIALTLTATYFTAGTLSSAMLANIPALSCTTAATPYASAIVGVVSGAGSGLAGSVVGAVASGSSFRAGLSSGLDSLALNAISGGMKGAVGNFFTSDMFARVVAHGAVDGVISVANKGNFASGFVSGIAGAIGANVDPLTASLLGGTASSLSGGRFEDGAMSALFTYIYNDRGVHSTNDLDSSTALMRMRMGVFAPTSEEMEAGQYAILKRTSTELNYVQIKLDAINGGINSIGLTVPQLEMLSFYVGTLQLAIEPSGVQSGMMLAEEGYMHYVNKISQSNPTLARAMLVAKGIYSSGKSIYGQRQNNRQGESPNEKY